VNESLHESTNTPAVPRVELAPGYTISRIIKGGWQLAGGHGTVEHDRALDDMHAYVRAGITTFDCADIYTGVEELIGVYLRAHGTEGVQVHTKCVPDLPLLDTLTADDLARTVQRSRARLGVPALDLVQFHWWDYARGDYLAAARALAELQQRRVIRHLGATNFGTAPLRALLDAGVPIVAHQVQYSLLDRRPAGAMAALCEARGVQLLCYGALAGGFFGERWLGAPEPVEPLENRSLVKYKLIIDECGGWDRFQALLALLADIGAQHGVGIGAVAVAWVLDQPAVAAVIAGARNRAHLADTLAAATLGLTPRDRVRLDAFLADQPVPPGDVYELERDREGRHGRIMRYTLNTG
jgi:aryl-alcohol dehydrogenase-like predicted oxidoreductase